MTKGFFFCWKGCKIGRYHICRHDNVAGWERDPSFYL